MTAGAISLIVPEATINYSPNPSMEINFTSNFSTMGAGTALARVVGSARRGIASGRITPGAATNAGVIHTAIGAGSAGVAATVSVDFKGETGIPYQLYFSDAAGVLKAGCTATTFTGDGAWHRYECSWTADGADLYVTVDKNNSASVAVFYIDGLQIERKAYSTTYCDGDRPGCKWNGVPGSSASTRSAQSRAGGRVYSLSGWSITVNKKQGLGMPPLALNSRPYALLPGGELTGVHVEPRVIQLACTVHGNADTVVNAGRQYLIDYLAPDGVATLQPVILRYTGESFELDIACVYEAGLERSVTRSSGESFILRLISFDPFWYTEWEDSAALDSNDTATLRYVCGRLASTGQWSALGLTANPTSDGDVNALLITPDGTLIVGGNFHGFNGQANWDFCVKRDPDGTWGPVGTAGDFNQTVRALAMSPDPNVVYIGGGFTNAAGAATADYICTYTISSNTVAALSGGGTGSVLALAVAPNGDVYIGGVFANWDGLGAGVGDNVVVYDLSAGDYALVANGLNSTVNALAIRKSDGILYAGGSFTADGAAAGTYRKIAYYNGTAWTEIGGGLDDTVQALTLDELSDLYATGAFHGTADSAITGLAHIAMFDGTAWQPLGDGLQAAGYHLELAPNGELYVGGVFTTAGGLAVADRVARWTGYSWALLDVDLPGSPVVYALAAGAPDPVITDNFDLFLGFDSTGAGYFAGAATVTNSGKAAAWPYFRIKRSGGTTATLQSIKNETTGKELLFNLDLLDGETITVDLRPGRRAVRSDFRGNLLGERLSGSDFTSFNLLRGANTLTCFISTAGAPTVEAACGWQNTYWSIDEA